MKSLYRIKRKWIDGFLLRGYRTEATKTLIIEPTNVCSLRCTCCPNGSKKVVLREKGLMSKELFDTIIQNIDMPVSRCFLHACGEPFLNQNLCYFAEKLIERNIKPVVFSNGYCLDMEGLDCLLKLKKIDVSFSMDLISPAHYEEIRKPAKYNIALVSLRKINEVFAQNKMGYGLNVIIGSQIISELIDSCTYLFNQFSNLTHIMLSSRWPWPDLPQTGDIEGHIAANGQLCKRFKEIPVILWNGDVSFCSFDYSGELIVGNIQEKSLSKIYNGEKAREIRRHILMGNFEPFCQKCLLPRYESYSIILLRNKYGKMSPRERYVFLQEIENYYAI